MDELLPLSQEIEFHERFRGYDPDEVDAYVDRVARAAAVIKGRLAELHERVDAAEARATVGETEETLTRTLVLAQRTADAAVAEGREEADRMTADAAASAAAVLSAAEAEAAATVKKADDHAGLVLAEAETDRRRILAEAQEIAATAAADERDRLAAEVAELQQYRAFLHDDIEILERHLTDERHQLAASLSAMTDLLENPKAFRTRSAPETSGVDVRPSILTVDPPADPGPSPDIDDATMDETAVDETAYDKTTLDESALAAPTLEDAAREDTAFEDTAFEDTAFENPVRDETAPDQSPVDDPVLDEPVLDQATPVDPSSENALNENVEPTIDLVAAEATPSGGGPVFDDTAFEERIFEEAAFDPPSPAASTEEDGHDDPESGDPGVFDDAAFDDQVAADADTGPHDGGRVEIDLDQRGEFDPGADDAAVVGASSPPRLITAADVDAGQTSGSRLGIDPGTGPSTAPMPVIQETSLFADPNPTTDDDPFLTQLRDAVDTEPAREVDDDALNAFFDHEEDDSGRSWFGRRR